MRLRYKLLIGAAVIVGAFAWGRFSAPVEIKEVEKIKVVQVEAKKEKKDVVTVVTEKPDGSKVTTVTDKTTTDTDSSTVATSDRLKYTSYKKPDWNITVFAGTDLRDLKLSGSHFGGPLLFGAEVQRRIVGPFHISGIVMTNWTVGVGLGVTF